jgi:hypothetical protein
MLYDPLSDAAVVLEREGGNIESGSGGVGAVRIPQGACAPAGSQSNSIVSFAIGQVPNVDLLQGAFRGLELMSPALTVQSGSVLAIDPNIGIEIDLCVDPAQTNATLCNLMLGRLRPVSSQGVASEQGDVSEVIGGCRKGTACPCSCAFATPHLTSFAVQDPDFAVAGEISVEQLTAGVELFNSPAPDVGGNDGSAGTPSPTPPLPSNVPPPTPQAENGGDSLLDSIPLIPVIAGCAAIAVIALAIIIRRRSRTGQYDVHHAFNGHHHGAPFEHQNPMRASQVPRQPQNPTTHSRALSQDAPPIEVNII